MSIGLVLSDGSTLLCRAVAAELLLRSRSGRAAPKARGRTAGSWPVLSVPSIKRGPRTDSAGLCLTCCLCIVCVKRPSATTDATSRLRHKALRWCMDGGGMVKRSQIGLLKHLRISMSPRFLFSTLREVPTPEDIPALKAQLLSGPRTIFKLATQCPRNRTSEVDQLFTTDISSRCSRSGAVLCCSGLWVDDHNHVLRKRQLYL